MFGTSLTYLLYHSHLSYTTLYTQYDHWRLPLLLSHNFVEC